MLRCYPSDFRDEFGDAMLEFFRARLTDPDTAASWRARSDVRESVRGLSKQPVLALVIVGTLSLGIGAKVAIFSVIRGVLLRPLPFREAAGIGMTASWLPAFRATRIEPVRALRSD